VHLDEGVREEVGNVDRSTVRTALLLLLLLPLLDRPSDVALQPTVAVLLVLEVQNGVELLPPLLDQHVELEVTLVGREGDARVLLPQLEEVLPNSLRLNPDCDMVGDRDSVLVQEVFDPLEEVGGVESVFGGLRDGKKLG
jgi:hypothetical protein